jgi:PAS domain S-box-containing protein
MDRKRISKQINKADLDQNPYSADMAYRKESRPQTLFPAANHQATANESHNMGPAGDTVFSIGHGEGNPGLFFLFDEKKRLIGWNPLSELITGYMTEELANLPPLNLIDEDSRTEMSKATDQSLLGNHKLVRAALVKKDGLKLPMNFRMWPLRISGHVYLAWTGTRISLPWDSNTKAGAVPDHPDHVVHIEDGAAWVKEKIFSSAFLKNSTPMAITSMVNGHYIAVSDAFLDLAGLEIEEVIGRTSVEIGFLDWSQIRTILGALKARGKVDQMELHYRGRDGKIRFALINCSILAMPDEDYLLTVVMDITDRKRVEEELRLSEERYRLCFHHANDVIFTIDSNYRLISISPSVEKALGYKADELVHRSVKDLHILTADSLKRAAVNNKRILSGETMDSEVYEFTAKDGSIHYGEVSASPLYEKGRITGLIAVARDITARRNMEEKMQQINAELQQLVAERTEMLVRTNRALQKDIKERIRAEDALLRSEEKYRNIFENCMEGITQTTPDGQIITANYAMAAMLGYESPTELLSSIKDAGAQIYLHPEARVKLRKEIDTVGEVKGYETQFVRKDGRQIWVSTNVQAVHDQTGKILYYQGITNDITKRKIAEEALAASEERYRRLIESTTDYIYSVVIKHGRPVASTHGPTCIGVTGYNPEEYGADPELWIRMVHPEDQELVIAQIKHLLSGKAPYPLEHRIYHKDGSIRWVLNTPVPNYNTDGNLISYDGTVKDITSRKDAEERVQASKYMLQTVFDGISDSLIMLDNELKVRMINRAAKDYFNLPSFKQVMGKPCFMAFYGRSEPCENCPRPFSLMHDYVGTYERPSRAKPGGIEQVVIYKALNKAGKLEATIVRISDITESRLAQKQILHTEKLASLGLLVSSITHEINNPNSFIIFNLPILRDYTEALLPIVDNYAQSHPDFEIFNMTYSEFCTDILKLLSNMEHGALRIKDIVAGLKEFTRNRSRQELKWLPINQIVEKAVAICHLELNKRVKSFEVTITPALPPVFTDPEALEQTLINLLLNAAQAMDKEDSWIKLRVYWEKHNTNSYIIEVSDNGSGIDEEAKTNIFSPFFTTKGSEGTGLGLYICQTLISGLGGRIEVESTPGRGSTFRIILDELHTNACK